MNVTQLPPGTLVVCSGSLGRIIKATRHGQVDGYSVSTAYEGGHEGYAPHFRAANSVQIAEVGVNVCRHPRGQHWCGLLHVSQNVIHALRHKDMQEATDA